MLGALGPPELLSGRQEALRAFPRNSAPRGWTSCRRPERRLRCGATRFPGRPCNWRISEGLKVWVYTINDPELANKLLDMGVDGIITNNTSLIWKTLATRGTRSRHPVVLASHRVGNAR